ncbi:peptide chain release factor N(5)-glutamine methyltransferase [Ensifer soli]|uniref:peptide chain release factor N(5)-glutamine methyltransferase n=1 Tax=Ciceribacter sp. sgz301302 TaxID=3342379 RepID=UPI0035BB67DE
MTLDALLAEIRARFQAGGIEGPAREARLLVSGLLDLAPAALITGGAEPAGTEAVDAARRAAARRLAGEPLHRILGWREFFGRRFHLSAGTLEPRPDTEVLVDRLLPHVRGILAVRGRCRILDLGTGTGAICLTLLAEVPGATGLGVDVCADALRTAVANAQRLGVSDRFAVIESDWFRAVAGTFEIVVSNPPYIARDVIATLDPGVRLHDPMAALDGGEDGLDAYRSLARGAAAHLADGGIVGVEIGFDQKDAVTRLFSAAGFVCRDAARDLGGQDRTLLFSLPRPD